MADNGRSHHTGAVYLNGDWLIEAANLDEVMKPAGKTPLWFATVDGVSEDGPQYLVNLASFKSAPAPVIPAEQTAARHGTQPAACSEGGQCVGLHPQRTTGCATTAWISARARTPWNSAPPHPGTGGHIELRLDKPDGELLGTCDVAATGDWQKWQTFTAKIKPTERQEEPLPGLQGRPQARRWSGQHHRSTPSSPA